MSNDARTNELAQALVASVPGAGAKLAQLQDRRKTIAAEKKDNKKQIRNETRKRQRLVKSAKKLSREELLQVLALQIKDQK